MGKSKLTQKMTPEKLEALAEMRREIDRITEVKRQITGSTHIKICTGQASIDIDPEGYEFAKVEMLKFYSKKLTELKKSFEAGEPPEHWKKK